MRGLLRHPFALLLLVCALWSAPAGAWARSTIEARVDQTAIDAQGRVRLDVQIETDPRDGSEPGQLLAPDLDDFDVVQQLQRQSYINGASSQTLTLVLRPRKTGKLTIPPFVLVADGKQSKTKPVVVTVTGAMPPAPAPTPGFDAPPADFSAAGSGTTAAASDRQAFLRWDVDKTTVYLGEQVVARLSLYVNRSLAVVDPNIRSFSTEGFWSEPLPQQRPEAQSVVLGRDVFIRNTVGIYRLFPLRAGQVRLPAVHADLILGDRSLFGGRRSRQPRDAEALSLEVRPLPTEGQPPGFAGPAVGRLSLAATVDRPEVHAENGVQLTVTTRIDGLIGNVPEPHVEAPDWHVYPATHETRTENNGVTVVGVRVSRMLLKPLKTGSLSIPPIKIAAFDPTARQYVVAETPAIPVSVQGVVTDPAARAPAAVDGRAAAGKAAASAPSPTPGEEPPSLRGIRAHSDLPLGSGPPWAHPVFPVVVALPPMLFFGLLGWTRWRAHLDAGAEGRAIRRAAAEARRQIEALSHAPDPRAAFAELSRLLVHFIECRLQLVARGATTDALRRRLLEAGLPADVVQGIAQELETCDFSRFSPGDVRREELGEAIRRALELVGRVDRHGGEA